MKKIFVLLGIIIITGLSGCKPEFKNPVNPDDVQADAGDADFTRYVAVGNSLTAGYMNGTLYKSGQANSFPKLLADRMKEAGDGEFTQPYLDDDTKDIGGMVMGNQVILQPKLVVDAGQGTVERINETPTMQLAPHPGPYNNMGVPNAKIFHYVFNGYGNIANVPAGLANPYFVRMASSPNVSVLQDAVSQNPTFFTIWLGNNDVLWYATSGGDGTNQTGNPDPATYGPNDLTDPGLFAYLYNQMLQALTANGAKGCVATLPDVASIPYMTTVPYNPVPLSDAQAQALNQAYAQYNGGLQIALQNGLITQEEAAKRTIHFEAGQNALVIQDEYLTDLTSLGLPSMRQTTANDLVVLPASGIIGKPDPNNPNLLLGITSPLEDKWVLTEDEIAETRAVTNQMNDAIRALAQQYDLAVVDMAAAMDELVQGLRLDDNSIYTADYFSGLATMPNLFFSLDGVHPNTKGYVILANKFIDAINAKYHSTLRHYDPGYFPTNITIKTQN